MTIRSTVAQIGVDAAALAEAARSTADPAALARVRTRAIELRSRCRDVRDDLDALDVLGTVDEGAELLEAAIWERQTRHDLLALERHAGDLAAAIGALQPGGYQQRTTQVRAGDTLQVIAKREMGDWRAWPQLVAANDIDPGEPLTVGSTLIVPEPE